MIGIFFDGTRNNRSNVEAGAAFQAEEGQKKKLDELTKEAQAYKK